MTAHVSMLLKSCVLPDMLPLSLCNKKTCNSAHEQTPLSNDTIDSVLRNREVGQAKDLPALPRSSYLRPTLFPLHTGTTGHKKLIKKPLRGIDNLL